MRRRPLPLPLLLLCWPPLGLVLARVRHPVPVLWMMPVSSGPGQENVTAAVAPAVRLALRDLQREPPPLGNYELQLQLLDSQVGSTSSVSWGSSSHDLLELRPSLLEPAGPFAVS